MDELLSSETASRQVYTIGEWSDRLWEELGKPDARCSLGWPLLDRFLAYCGEPIDATKPGTLGVMRPASIVLGAEPKAGKSIWAQIISTHRAEQGDWVLYVDLENGMSRILRRMLGRRSRLGVRALQEAICGVGPESNRQAANEARTWLHTLSTFHIVDEKSFSLPYVRGMLNAFKALDADKGIFVVIDSLQKLQAPKAESRRREVELLVTGIEALRSEFNCVILFISELSRESASHAGGKAANRFKETGEIAYSADLSMTFDRDGVLSVDLYRDGETGRVARYEKVFPYFGMKELPVDSESAPMPKEVGPSPKVLALVDKMAEIQVYSEQELVVLFGLELTETRKVLDEAVNHQKVLHIGNKGYVRILTFGESNE